MSQSINFRTISFLPQGAQPFSFFDDSSEDGQENKDKTMSPALQMPSDNVCAMHNGHPHNAENGFFVEPRTQSSPPNGSISDIEGKTPLSALPSNLNVHKKTRKEYIRYRVQTCILSNAKQSRKSQISIRAGGESIEHFSINSKTTPLKHGGLINVSREEACSSTQYAQER